MIPKSKINEIGKQVLAGLTKFFSLVMVLIQLIKQALIGLVKRPGLQLGPNSAAPDLGSLSSLALAPNWPVGRNRRMPHYLVRGRGKLLDAVSQQLLDQVYAEREDLNVSAGRVAEATSTPGKAHALRFVHQFGPGQLLATDAMLRAEGPDLYLKLECRPRSVLRYLQYAFYGIAFCATMAAAIYLYFVTFGAWRGWVVEYAQKYAASEHLNEQNRGSFFERKLINGYYETKFEDFRARLRNDKDACSIVVKSLAAVQLQIDNDAYNSIFSDPSAVPRAFDVFYRTPIPVLAFGNILHYMYGDPEPRLNFSGKPDDPSDIEAYERARAKSELDPAAKVIKTLDILCAIYLATSNQTECYFTIVIGQTHSVNALTGQQYSVVHTSQVVDKAFLSMPLSILVSGNSNPDTERIQKALFSHFDECTTYHPPISSFALFNKDPRMGMMHLGLPLGIMAGVIGFFVWRMPQSWLRFPCRWLGWMTPEDFEASVEGKNGWLERCLLSTVLHEHFEVDRSDIIDLRH
jgi:hypothetical protein